MTIDTTQTTGEEIIRAMITLDELATPVAELRPGDRIIYRRRGVIHETIVADAHALGDGAHSNSPAAWWSITTTAGDSWECSPKNRGQYRVPTT